METHEPITVPMETHESITVSMEAHTITIIPIHKHQNNQPTHYTPAAHSHKVDSSIITAHQISYLLLVIVILTVT